MSYLCYTCEFPVSLTGFFQNLFKYLSKFLIHKRFYTDDEWGVEDIDR